MFGFTFSFSLHADAVAVLVLFVFMMLDLKAIENPWSAEKKRLLDTSIFVCLHLLMVVGCDEELLGFFKM